MTKKNKQRIDTLLVDLGLVETRTRAQALLMAGAVLVNNEKVDKAGAMVDIEADITLKEKLPYVSRGGLKLKGALEDFHIDLTGLNIIDIGSSTGGFTDCALQNGASRAICIDVGKGLLDIKLRTDERVKVFEGVNFRHMEFKTIGEKSDIAFFDLSFISVEKVIEKVKEFLTDEGRILCLVKPQFEVGPKNIGKGGIVRDDKIREAALKRVTDFVTSKGFKVLGSTVSSIKGTKGNIEYWLYLSV